jgi:phenylacetic acid degradation operon negative regulatory protein
MIVREFKHWRRLHLMKITPRKIILDILMAGNGMPLSSKEAVSACLLFGIGEVSTRVALTRLLSEQLTETAGRGIYKLGPNAMEIADDVSTWRTTDQVVRVWHGDYITVYGHALGRTDRTALVRRERALRLLGFRELEKGLYIRPNNIGNGLAGVVQRLQHLGLEPEALVCVSSQFDQTTEQRIQTLWDGAALNRTYRQLSQQLQEWMQDVDELPLDIAAKEALLLGRSAIHQVVFDPLLPAPMVDVAERERFVKVVRQFDKIGKDVWLTLRQANFEVPQTVVS